MAEIRVTYKRTWQPKQYESEGLELTIVETVNTAPLGMIPSEMDKRAQVLATLESLVYKQLAAVGDAAMLDRLAVAPLAQEPTRRPGHPGGPRR